MSLSEFIKDSKTTLLPEYCGVDFQQFLGLRWYNLGYFDFWYRDSDGSLLDVNLYFEPVEKPFEEYLNKHPELKKFYEKCKEQEGYFFHISKYKNGKKEDYVGFREYEWGEWIHILDDLERFFEVEIEEEEKEM